VQFVDIEERSVEFDGMQDVATLTQGQSFGELALLNQKPRSATMLCTTDCDFAVIDKQSYDKVIRQIQKKIQNERVQFLRSIPFFAKWTKTSLTKFSLMLKPRKLKRNQIVFREGDECDWVFIVKKGEFEVKKKVLNTAHNVKGFDYNEFLPQTKTKVYGGNVKC